jgi:hypothetical protein
MSKELVEKISSSLIMLVLIISSLFSSHQGACPTYICYFQQPLFFDVLHQLFTCLPGEMVPWPNLAMLLTTVQKSKFSSFLPKIQ